MQTPDLVTAEEVESLLETSWAARPVVYEEEQASTNQTAKMLAEQGASHGTLVVAERQVSGRGRTGSFPRYAGGCRASGVRQRQTGKNVAFTEGQRYLDEYSFKTSDSSDVSVYADTGSSDGCL